MLAEEYVILKRVYYTHAKERTHALMHMSYFIPNFVLSPQRWWPDECKY